MTDLPNALENGVQFLPWIGERYETGPRLLVLGESHYSREKEPSSYLTQRVTRGFVEGTWTHRYWTQIARTIEGRALAANECRDVWHAVAFYNFVQHFVGESPGARPTDAMWQSAAGPFLYVMAQLKPRAVLVTGKELWNRIPEGRPIDIARRDGSKWPGTVYADATGSSVIATYVNHPASRGFSWRKWDDVAAAVLTR